MSLIPVYSITGAGTKQAAQMEMSFIFQKILDAPSLGAVSHKKRTLSHLLLNTPE